MGKPAARITDAVAHPLPPVLTGGPGSPNVFIGGLPAWRGVPAGAAAAIQAAKQASQTTSSLSATASTMTATIRSGASSADIHLCTTPSPPHGPGVVINGSATVLINGLPACRMGDTIIEALGPPNKIVGGCPTVEIGG